MFTDYSIIIAYLLIINVLINKKYTYIYIFKEHI